MCGLMFMFRVWCFMFILVVVVVMVELLLVYNMVFGVSMVVSEVRILCLEVCLSMKLVLLFEWFWVISMGIWLLLVLWVLV